MKTQHFLCLAFFFGNAAAFSVHKLFPQGHKASLSVISPPLSSSGLLDSSSLFSTFAGKVRQPFQKQLQSSSTAVLETQTVVNYGPHIKVGKKKKILTLIGLLFCVNTMLSCFFTFPLFCITYAYGKLLDPKRRRHTQRMVNVWAWLAMKSVFYQPKVEGLENLPPHDEGVLYLANHTSYLDILTLSAFIPRAFKYLSKSEILKIPGIGWSMQMAGHISLRREDPRSQLETVKETIMNLKDGNSVCIFPEGTRTVSGRMGNFKKGPFTIAKKSGARIVPISLCYVTKWYPNTAMFPLARPTDVVVKIHPPISTEGYSEAELMEKTFEAIEAGLPVTQHKLKVSEKTSPEN